MCSIHRSIGYIAIIVGLSAALGVTAQDKSGTSPKSDSGSVNPRAGEDAAEKFVVDGVHSSNVFKIRHNGVASFYGRFNNVGGSAVWNAKDPSAGAIVVEVKADSVDTNSGNRDKHLKSPDFFDVEKYPTFGFKSASIKKAGEHNFEVSGDLTLHGVTKPITVKFEQAGPADTRQGRRIGLETTFTIKRSDYGMTKFLEGNALGDDVTMTLSLECAAPRGSEGG